MRSSRERLDEFSLSFTLLVLRYVFGVEEHNSREREILVDEKTDEPFFFSPHFYFTLQNIRKSKRLRYKRATVPTEGDLATAKNKERVERAGIITDNTAGKRPRTAGRADSGATGSGATTTSEEVGDNIATGKRVIITTVVVIIMRTMVCTTTIIETLREPEIGCVRTGAGTCTRASRSAFDVACTSQCRQKCCPMRTFQITDEGTGSDITLGLGFSTGTRRSFRRLPRRRRSKRPRNNNRRTEKVRRRETKETTGRWKITLTVLIPKVNNNTRFFIIET